MSCCNGKKTTDKESLDIIEKIKKMGSIAEGTIKSSISRIVKCDYAPGRFTICESCEYLTWLKPLEYFSWLKDNGLSVIKNLNKLDTLPDLPKKERLATTIRFCMKCKCDIIKKVHSKSETCPLNKW